MAQDFGNGVSRTLSALQRQFQTVVWQASKPPLDSELNLMSQMEMNRMAEAVRSQMHSGFLLDPMMADADFVTNSSWSNWFKFGRPSAHESAPLMWANVNGWIIPVTGTGVTDGDPSNRIDLYNPPGTASRIDLVFLEVWQGQIAANPSTANKPSASTIYKYGNTEFGGTNFNDEMKDPTIGYETTERVQIQYRIRTYGSGAGLGDSVDLSQYPDGLDDPTVLAQGAMADPVTGYVWANMGDTLGDRGLWRSGDGGIQSRTDLGTVDGYVYAVPICAVFRRNSSPFVALTDSGNANQNGGLDRNPVSGSITDPLQATRTFTPVTLTDDLAAAATGVISVTGLAGSGLDNVNINWDAMAVQIEDEIMVIQAVNASSGEIMIASTTDTVNPWTGAAVTATAGRGRFGTQDAFHVAGSGIKFFNFRPDDLYADQIASQDVLDLRRGITPGEWSYEDVLKHNLGRVLDGSLRSSYKQGSGTDTQGVEIIEVDTYLSRYGGSLPNQTEQLDGFDGIRQVFSDSAVVQNDVSLLLTITGGAPALSGDSWDAGPSFTVDGFVPSSGTAWVDNTVITLTIGGIDGTVGARGTSDTAARFMRFLSPSEYWLTRDDIISLEAGVHGNQTPFLMRFVGDVAGATAPYPWCQPAGKNETPADHPGPMFPLIDGDFNYPYIVLGGLANTAVPLYDAAATTFTGGATGEVEIDLSIGALDFDTAGQWYATDVAEISTAGITNLLLHGTRNLYDLLTKGGTDLSGRSSELYITMKDVVNDANNGCFRVIGAGTAGYTWFDAANQHSVVIERVGVTGGAVVDAMTVIVGFRTKYMNTADDPSGTYPAIAIVLTDLDGVTGGTSNPWNGVGTSFDGQMVLDTSLVYGPSRGATARVANRLSRFAIESPSGANVTVLREAPENIDPDSTGFRSRTGVPQDEYYYPVQPVPTWNRLPSLGGHAPNAPDYGSGRYNFETRREAELFVDEGSKSVIFRPFQQMDMAWSLRTAGTDQVPALYDDGVTAVMGGSGLFQLDHIFALPPEYMPRFGRQDIPIRSTAGTNGPYIGINHLFGDSQTTTDLVRYVIGGSSAVSPVATDEPLLVTTAASSGLVYGAYGGASVGFQGRLYEDVNARSSDINKPLRGIQFPPYLGAARVYAVYEAADYAANGSCYTDEGFTKKTTGSYATNLLRMDADKQTLFIVKDGAEDVLAGHNAHTYLIPEEALNIELAPAWATGTVFSTFEYVVEVAAFGFTEGFVNRSNYVMLRTDAEGEFAPLDGLYSNGRMIIPAALESRTGGGIRGYSAYTRTVYQGDPYMTRDGASLQTADYQYRYGQVPVSDANMVNTPLQQYDTGNDQIPEIPNARSLEVLASVDFWTTMGTGKMGGPVYAGTPTDPGFLTASGTRLPASGTQNQWQPLARAFTEAQPSTAGFASQGVVCYRQSEMSDQTVTITRGTVTVTFEYGVGDWTVGATEVEVINGLVGAITNDVTCTNTIGVWAEAVGTECLIYARMPGHAGTETVVHLTPATASPYTQTGIKLSITGLPFGAVGRPYQALLSGASNLPVNAKESFGAVTPLPLTGMTERLPLGILVQDSDFLGEDPLRKGMAYEVISGGGDQSTTAVTTFSVSGQENTRLSGPGGQLGMADGAILQYTAYNAATAPDGVKQFRLYRGGGSAYVLADHNAGGPVDFTSGGFSEGDDPILKGAVLVGRAYLVRNEHEVAFTGNVTRSYGDELQMVVLTNTVYGESLDCDSGYVLDGILSPTDYGKGYAASDRYRLEGKPLVKSRAALLDPDIELAPYPPEDPPDDDPCP